MKINIFISIFFIICSCVESAKKPVINSNDFANIIKAIHLTEAKHTLILKSDSKNDSSLKLAYDSIFTVYSTTEELFFESMNYYTNNSDQLNSIYKSIIEELENERKNLP